MIDVAIETLKIPVPSASSVKVLQLLGHDNLNFSDLADILERDQRLGASILRYANSPLYHRGKHITNVREALNLLGLVNVRVAVLNNTLAKFGANCSIKACEYLNRFSLATATLARMLAQKLGEANEEEVEMGAVMVSMESLVLASNFPKEYQIVFKKAQESGLPLKAVEKAVFSLSDEKYGSWLARHMGLSEVIKQVVITFKQAESIESVNNMVDYYCGLIALAQAILYEDNFLQEDLRFSMINTSLADLQHMLGLSDQELAECRRDYPLNLEAIHA